MTAVAFSDILGFGLGLEGHDLGLGLGLEGSWPCYHRCNYLDFSI